MGCCGDREKGPTKVSQKWEFITLTDFRATSAWNSVAYVWLWILFLSTIVIYAVDTFTAINLIVFNKWASQVKPTIPFEYSKWIFAGCIIFSWALWGFEWFRAVRVIKRGGVADSYMDPLAAELQSIRKQGWRRFLVFAALTKSKKGADLVAFFAYFAFKGAIRIILAEGPRQVINTLTLIAVIKADFIESERGNQKGASLFLANLSYMWDTNKLQAIIICSMLYSLAIWLLSAISLATAAILYIVFLWHYIPSQDGSLAKYCRRKIDKRLERIVESKVKAAIEEEEARRRRAEEKQQKAQMKAEKKGKAFNGDEKFAITRQPTLPQLDDGDDMKNPLQRQDTMTSVNTLPLYNSRPGTQNENRPPLSGYASDRPVPARSATMNSQWSNADYEPDAPLLANAAQAGQSMSRPGTAFSRQDSNAYGRAMTPGQRPYTPGYGPPRMGGESRPFTPGQGRAGDGRPYSPAPPRMPGDQRSYSPGPPRMPQSAGERPYSPGPPRMPQSAGERPYSPSTLPGESQRSFSPMLRTDFSQGGAVPQSAVERSAAPWSAQPGTELPFGGPQRCNTGPMLTRQATNTSIDRPAPAMTRQQTFGSTSSTASFSRPIPPQQRPNFTRPFTPTSSSDVISPPDSNSYEMKPNPYTSKENKSAGGYVAFNPARTASPAPVQPPAPQRSNTATTDYFSMKPTTADRSATAPPTDNRQTFGYSDLVSGYGRSGTPSPPPPAPAKSYTNNRF